MFHHHAGGYVETPDEVRYLLEETDPDLIGLVLDTGHYAFGGGMLWMYSEMFLTGFGMCILKTFMLGSLTVVVKRAGITFERSKKASSASLAKGRSTLGLLPRSCIARTTMAGSWWSKTCFQVWGIPRLALSTIEII